MAISGEPYKCAVDQSALRIKDRQRSLELRTTFDEIPYVPVRHPAEAVRDYGFGRLRPRPDLMWDGFGSFKQRGEFTTHGTSGPQAVVDGKTFSHVLARRRTDSDRSGDRYCRDKQ
jgi:hypothetical protein